MGYDLHITRRKSWSDPGDDITAEEWLAYVGRDPELSLARENGTYFAVVKGLGLGEGAWLDWRDGVIYSKNPDPPLIDKMVSIARHFKARVEGDDGEIYESGHKAPRQPTVPFWTRLAGLVARPRPSKPHAIKHAPVPFVVGDTVIDIYNKMEYLVLKIDPKAEHGMGVIWTRNPKGKVIGHCMINHPLKPKM